MYFFFEKCLYISQKRISTMKNFNLRLLPIARRGIRVMRFPMVTAVPGRLLGSAPLGAKSSPFTSAEGAVT